MRRMEMLKAREILRLKHEIGLSLREIGQACNCGKSSVSETLARAEKAGLTWPIELTDKQLMSALYPPVESKTLPLEPDMDYVFNEMKKKNVTLMLLWEEYKKKNPAGIMYSQFCERYRNFKKHNKISMHKEHKAGEEVEVDWAGDTMSYVEPGTGEIKKAYLFVAVLPASAYPFVYAYGDQKTPNWIDAHVRTFEYFGGVPKVTIPDNTKTAVIKSDLVDPVLNKSYNEMARHYRTTLVPARAGRPKDKAADENMVGIVSRRIIAVLRNTQFFSLYEINQALSEELVKLILRPFQKMQGNRLTAFEQIDKPCLQPLPATKYEYSDWREGKIQFNYHIEYDRFFYSVHYAYVNQSCSVRATTRVVEVYVGNERIAAYPRNYNASKRYTTLPEHMPEEHKAVSGWSSERFLSWAEKTGPHTRELIKQLLESREYPMQTYRACMGIMRFGKSYSAEIMERASRDALDKNTCSFKYFSMILKQLTVRVTTISDEKIIQHDNVRGSSAYTGGGFRA
ncbi:IS21 family transposase [Paenibacillus sp. GP183]|uniref:IS21 family transposase n=1 Tax=Paenibacillus sp. GP183 TaxID=1882751 RepID=UPI00089A8C36|nr:IS21 family transposase [Paenibacillus sp. GP183]SEB73978.1 Transposase [Paenibacillus sp. GP183]